MPSSWNCTASWRSCWLSALLATSSTGGPALGIQDEQHGVGLLDRLLGLGAHERKVVGRSLGQGLLRRQALRLDAAGIHHGELQSAPLGVRYQAIAGGAGGRSPPRQAVACPA